MPAVAQTSGDPYRLLGYVVWRGAKWYLRRRLPATRKLAVGGLVTVGALALAAVAAKRLSA
ncbi:MAG TPA: hypothetical protein VK252_02230 [Solirubrobacteraceae bacterium]|nr:hypothetical protein [Solirubrobacteraceae bacterium]